MLRKGTGESAGVDLASLLEGNLYAYALTFCRIGAALMVLPGFGEVFVPPRVRLAFGVLLSVAIAPAVPDLPRAMPNTIIELVGPIANEIIVGLFFGLLARSLIAAVETAGMMISFQMSLANAVAFNPAMASQGSIIGSFLSVAALVVVFTSNTHHLIIFALADTYRLVPIGGPPPMEDMANAMARAVAHAFSIALRLAAPFILLGLTFNTGLGVLARLMPQIQIFFVGIPLQLMGGLAVMFTVLAAVLGYWLSQFQDALTNGFVGL